MVRASRVEIVDADGQVRAVLGEVSRPAYQDSSFGLALFDADGRLRLRVALEATGPVVVFNQAVNSGVELGLHDPGPDALHVGAYLMVGDADGTAVAGWRVEDDGSVTPYTGD